MSNKYEFIKTGTSEYIKQFLTYDGQSRMEFVYEARANASHGEPCPVTQYVYDGLSNRVTKMKETQGVWDSSYDI